MKKQHPNSLYFRLALLPALLLASCSGHDRATRESSRPDTVQVSDSLPHIVFTQNAIDIGKMIEGETAEVVFNFYNSGAKDLLISGIETSCGCTTVDWSKKPYAHGMSGSIRVRFDSRDFEGLQNKSLRITTNSRKPEEYLAVTAEVIPKQKAN